MDVIKIIMITTIWYKNHIYKQKDGYRWIYKDTKQMRCNKNDIDLYLNNEWSIGMLKK